MYKSDYFEEEKNKETINSLFSSSIVLAIINILLVLFFYVFR
jgi:hypothetical protein